MWDLLSAAVFTRKRRAAAASEAEQLVALAGLAGGGRILDVPCGEGRHAIELARRGFAVTGVDRTAAFLESARSRAAEAGIEVEWIRSDMRTFHRAEAFDLVINMYSSFGYFDDPADDLAVARGFGASLRPGGRLVMEMVGKEVLAAQFQPRRWHELDDGSVMLEHTTIEDHWRRVRNRWILFRDGRRHERSFALRIYSAGELIGLLEQAGFTEVSACGSLAGEPYDEAATRLVILARR